MLTKPFFFHLWEWKRCDEMEFKQKYYQTKSQWNQTLSFIFDLFGCFIWIEMFHWWFFSFLKVFIINQNSKYWVFKELFPLLITCPLWWTYIPYVGDIFSFVEWRLVSGPLTQDTVSSCIYHGLTSMSQKKKKKTIIGWWQHLPKNIPKKHW